MSQSNDAVGNALIRLCTDPRIRPLRIGNLSRIEEDSRIFIRDRVLTSWLDAVRHDCLKQMDRNEELVCKISDAKQAFSNLNSVLGNYQRTTDQIAAQNQTKDDLDKQKEELIADRKRVTELVEHLKRQQSILEDLSAWASSQHNSLPSLELLSEPSLQELAKQTIEEINQTLSVVLDRINDAEVASVDQSEPNEANSGAGGSWSRLMTRVKTTVGNISSREPWQISWNQIDKIESSCSSWLRLVSLQKAAAAAKTLHPLLFKAIANCQNAPEETTEWSAICRDIQAHLPVIFDTAIPVDLDHLTASLKPDGQWLAILENLAVLCETLTGPCRKIFIDALARIHQQAETEKNTLKEETSDAQIQLDKNKAAVRVIDADICDVQYALDELQVQLDEQHARWAELWPQICPDLEEVTVTPAEITRNGIDQRQSDFDAWLSSQQDIIKRQQQWDSIRRNWIVRISDPRIAENKDLQSDYAKHANVVGLTCLESGQKSFYEDEDFRAFDTIIIDEVSKATPPELLMAMMCSRRVFLFADYRQLPPMYKRKESTYTEAVAEGQIAAEDFERYRQLVTSSFFQEMFEAAPDSIRQSLLEQFRMHPQIMAVIDQFYDGKLIAAGGPEQLDKLRQHHLVIRDRQGGWFLEPSQHALWIDSSKDARGRIVTEEQLGSSKLNLLEVELVLASLIRLNKALRKRGYGPSQNFKASSAKDGMRVGDWVKKLMPYAVEQTIADLFTRRQIKYRQAQRFTRGDCQRRQRPAYRRPYVDWGHHLLWSATRATAKVYHQSASQGSLSARCSR